MAADNRGVQALIAVIGTHRSGTTLLGDALGRHPEVAYWEEPRHVWSLGHNYRQDDTLTSADAGPRCTARIQSRFSRYLERSGRIRLAEKTPSNCLRLPFIDAIFPDALFLHIHRDGRAVMRSTDVVNRKDKPHSDQTLKRLVGTPLWEWPALLPRAWRTLGQRLLGRPMTYWGPRPPGWQEWVREDPRLTVLAKQWRYSIEPVLEFRRTMPDSRWLDLPYHELVTQPAELAGRIERFLGLTPSPEFQAHLVSECRTNRIDAWREHLEPDALGTVRPILEPALNQLGYDW